MRPKFTGHRTVNSALRQQAGSTMGPSCIGRSLTSLLISENEPTWLSDAREIYGVQILGRTAGHSFSVSCVKPGVCFFNSGPAPSSWRSVAGPISAIWLSLKGIRWKLEDSVALLSDFGEYVILTEVSPAFLKRLLRQAVLRELEGEAAAKSSSGVPALCYDVVKLMLRSI
eukprot:9489282-Pyramimonas_sp.AAC.1